MTERELAEILRRNPDIRVVGDSAPEPQPAAATTSAKNSALTRKFLAYWRALDGPALTPELRFDPARRWRFDFAHEPTRIAVELNGGVWSNGRHTRGTGYLRDREKINAAQLAGWHVFELGTGQVSAATVRQIIEFIRSQEAQHE